jgi:hypothetical protein
MSEDDGKVQEKAGGRPGGCSTKSVKSVCFTPFYSTSSFSQAAKEPKNPTEEFKHATERMSRAFSQPESAETSGCYLMSRRGCPRSLSVVQETIIIYTCKRIYAYMTKNAVSEPQTSRLTITWSKEADHALRTFLGSQGMKKGDLSKFIEEAVRWRIFHQTVREARAAFADVSPDKLQKMIDEAVEVARAKHYRTRAQRS